MNPNASWRSWVIPPAISAWANNRLGNAIRFDDSCGTWESAAKSSGGYKQQEIIRKVQASTAAVLRGEALFERDGVLFNYPDYRWPVAAGLLSVAARDGSLRVLDFGGSLGSTYWQHRNLFRGVDIEWGVVEQSEFAQAGKQLEQNEVRFFESIQAASTEIFPNVVLLSSVLQYLPDPYTVLEELLRTQANTLIIDRTPVSEESENIACIQKVPRDIYPASYPAWVFSRSWLLNQFSGWDLVAQFDGIEPTSTTSSGISFSWDGFITRRKSHD
jgi:putative methyltransferase (TIGR04325 family)